MLIKFKRKIKSISHFIWLILLIIITSLVTYFYELNKDTQYKNIKKTLNNIYFQKTFAKITSELEDRYIEFDYIIKEGDNYESIINNIEITKKEKNLFLETVKKDKKIKILKPNQKIYIKIDKKNIPKIENFIIEINKKKEAKYTRDYEKNIFN